MLLGKGMNSLIPFSYGLNRITVVLLQGWLYDWIIHESWYAIKQRKLITSPLQRGYIYIYIYIYIYVMRLSPSQQMGEDKTIQHTAVFNLLALQFNWVMVSNLVEKFFSSNERDLYWVPLSCVRFRIYMNVVSLFNIGNNLHRQIHVIDASFDLRIRQSAKCKVRISCMIHCRYLHYSKIASLSLSLSLSLSYSHTHTLSLTLTLSFFLSFKIAHILKDSGDRMKGYSKRSI